GMRREISSLHHRKVRASSREDRGIPQSIHVFASITNIVKNPLLYAVKIWQSTNQDLARPGRTSKAGLPRAQWLTRKLNWSPLRKPPILPSPPLLGCSPTHPLLPSRPGIPHSCFLRSLIFLAAETASPCTIPLQSQCSTQLNGIDATQQQYVPLKTSHSEQMTTLNAADRRVFLSTPFTQKQHVSKSVQVSPSLYREG
ncbi:mCG145084, partial [Mus musculus]